MSRLGHALIAQLLLALSLGALASGVDTYQFRHPELQNRAQELARALRCPQCQNQNLVESNSPHRAGSATRGLPLGRRGAV
ncbi:cytochrome c-type biogenesis protein CcmH [Aeromonas veronii]|uniref:cytochrome c-type biogenesis protein CcmH n=1 Tax=Aeromonas veronii TaxID=654 RepID=UPI003C6F016E